MDIPLATPLAAEGDYADAKVYRIAGHSGFFRRLKPKCGKQPGVVTAVFDQFGLRTAPFRFLAPDPTVAEQKAH